MTSTIQPPLLPWAWQIAVGDPRQESRIASWLGRRSTTPRLIERLYDKQTGLFHQLVR